jgi:hypothetical protein
VTRGRSERRQRALRTLGWTAAGGIIGLVGALLLCSQGLRAPTPPATAQFIGGDAADSTGTQWYYWIIHSSLAEGSAPLHTDMAYHPWGLDLGAQTGANFLDAILAYPLWRLLGWPASFNLLCVLILALNVATFVPLGLHLFRDRAAPALLGALVWAFNPYVLLQAATGQIKNDMIWPIPLMVLGLSLTRRRPGWGWPVLAGVGTALTALSYWYYGLFMLPPALAWLLLVRKPAGGWKRFTARLAVAVAVCTVLVSPVLRPILAGFGSDEPMPGFVHGPGFSTLEEQYSPPGTAIYDYFGRTPMMRGVLHPLERAVDPYETGDVVVLPWAAILLLAVFLWRGRRKRLLLGGGMMVAWVMSLGPVVLVDGTVPIVAPYLGAFVGVPFMARLNFPYQQLVVFYLGLALATGYLWTALQARKGHPAWRFVPVALVAAMMVETALSGMVPLPVAQHQQPPVYAALDTLGEGHLIVLPFSGCASHRIEQTHHGRKVMVGGHGFDPVRLQPPPFQEFLARNRLVASMHDLTRGRRTTVAWASEDLEEVRGLGYRFVVLFQEESVAIQDFPRAVEELARHFTLVHREPMAAAFDLDRPLAPPTFATEGP